MGTLNDGICVGAKSCNIQFPAGEYRENNYLWLCCNMSASFCIWVDCLRLTFSMSTCWASCSFSSWRRSNAHTQIHLFTQPCSDLHWQRIYWQSALRLRHQNTKQFWLNALSDASMIHICLSGNRTWSSSWESILQLILWVTAAEMSKIRHDYSISHQVCWKWRSSNCSSLRVPVLSPLYFNHIRW